MDKKILIINGPNLEMLGKRKESVYGNFTVNFLIINLLFFNILNIIKYIDFNQKNIKILSNYTYWEC